MLNSKYFTVIVAVTAVAMIATAVFQVLEMLDYNLFSTMFK